MTLRAGRAAGKLASAILAGYITYNRAWAGCALYFPLDMDEADYVRAALEEQFRGKRQEAEEAA